MMQILFNLILTSSVLSVVLWVSKSNPILGGFIVSLPISTLIVLAFSQLQNQQTENTFLLAKSIFIAVPSTLVFFVPFLIADRFKLSFWMSYFCGLGLLVVSYFFHKWVMQWLSK